MDKDVIYEIQEALRKLSFYDPRLIPLTVDGIFGAQTKQAVTVFQTLYGLEPTGSVDRATWEELQDSVQDITAPPVQPIHIFPNPSFLLRPNEENENELVQAVQQMLNILSEYYANILSVTINGIYDEPTVNEIRKIQEMHRIEPTGMLDVLTWNVLATVFNNRFDTVKR